MLRRNTSPNPVSNGRESVPANTAPSRLGAFSRSGASSRRGASARSGARRWLAAAATLAGAGVVAGLGGGGIGGGFGVDGGTIGGGAGVGGLGALLAPEASATVYSLNVNFGTTRVTLDGAGAYKVPAAAWNQTGQNSGFDANSGTTTLSLYNHSTGQMVPLTSTTLTWAANGRYASANTTTANGQLTGSGLEGQGGGGLAWARVNNLADAFSGLLTGEVSSSGDTYAANYRTAAQRAAAQTLTLYLISGNNNAATTRFMAYNLSTSETVRRIWIAPTTGGTIEVADMGSTTCWTYRSDAERTGLASSAAADLVEGIGGSYLEYDLLANWSRIFTDGTNFAMRQDMGNQNCYETDVPAFQIVYYDGEYLGGVFVDKRAGDRRWSDSGLYHENSGGTNSAWVNGSSVAVFDLPTAASEANVTLDANVRADGIWVAKGIVRLVPETATPAGAPLAAAAGGGDGSVAPLAAPSGDYTLTVANARVDAGALLDLSAVRVLGLTSAENNGELVLSGIVSLTEYIGTGVLRLAGAETRVSYDASAGSAVTLAITGLAGEGALTRNVTGNLTLQLGAGAAAGDVTTFDGRLLNNGTSATITLEKHGPGTIVLTGAAGASTISRVNIAEGVLELKTVNAIGSGTLGRGVDIYALTGAPDKTLRYSGVSTTEKIGTLDLAAAGNDVRLTIDIAAGRILSIDKINANKSSEANSGKLTKTGAGTLRFTSDGNTYNDGLIIYMEEGVLSLAKPASQGTPCAVTWLYHNGGLVTFETGSSPKQIWANYTMSANGPDRAAILNTNGLDVVQGTALNFYGFQGIITNTNPLADSVGTGLVETSAGSGTYTPTAAAIAATAATRGSIKVAAFTKTAGSGMLTLHGVELLTASGDITLEGGIFHLEPDARGHTALLHPTSSLIWKGGTVGGTGEINGWFGNNSTAAANFGGYTIWERTDDSVYDPVTGTYTNTVEVPVTGTIVLTKKCAGESGHTFANNINVYAGQTLQLALQGTASGDLGGNNAATAPLLLEGAKTVVTSTGSYPVSAARLVVENTAGITTARPVTGAGEIVLSGGNATFQNTVTVSVLTVNAGRTFTADALYADSVVLAEASSRLVLAARTNAPDAGAIGSIRAAAGSTVDIGGTTSSPARSLAVSDGNLFFGAFTGGGALVKETAGEFSLYATQLHTGGTTVKEGTLTLYFATAQSPASNILPASTALTLAGGELKIIPSRDTSGTIQTFASTATTGDAVILLDNTPGGGVDATQPYGGAAIANVQLGVIKPGAGTLTLLGSDISVTGGGAPVAGAVSFYGTGYGFNPATDNAGNRRLPGTRIEVNGVSSWAAVYTSAGNNYIVPWQGLYTNINVRGGDIPASYGTVDVNIIYGGSASVPAVTLATGTAGDINVASLTYSAAPGDANGGGVVQFAAGQRLVVATGDVSIAAAGGSLLLGAESALAIPGGAPTALTGAVPGTITAGADGGYFLRFSNFATADASRLVVFSAIADNGANAVGVGVTGDVVLAGTNTYTGGTSIAEGATLRLGSPDTSGVPAAAYLASGSANVFTGDGITGATGVTYATYTGALNNSGVLEVATGAVQTLAAPSGTTVTYTGAIALDTDPNDRIAGLRFGVAGAANTRVNANVTLSGRGIIAYSFEGANTSAQIWVGGSESNTNTGGVRLIGHTAAWAGIGGLVLAKTGGAVAIPAGTTLTHTGPDASLSTASTVLRFAYDNQFGYDPVTGAGVVIRDEATNGGGLVIALNGTTQTVQGLQNDTTGGSARIWNQDTTTAINPETTARTAGTLIIAPLATDPEWVWAYSIRDAWDGTAHTLPLNIVKDGEGTQIFKMSDTNGATGTLTVNAGLLEIRATTASSAAYYANTYQLNGGTLRITGVTGTNITNAINGKAFVLNGGSLEIIDAGNPNRTGLSFTGTGNILLKSTTVTAAVGNTSNAGYTGGVSYQVLPFVGGVISLGRGSVFEVESGAFTHSNSDGSIDFTGNAAELRLGALARYDIRGVVLLNTTEGPIWGGLSGAGVVVNQRDGLRTLVLGEGSEAGDTYDFSGTLTTTNTAYDGGTLGAGDQLAVRKIGEGTQIFSGYGATKTNNTSTGVATGGGFAPQLLTIDGGVVQFGNGVSDADLFVGSVKLGGVVVNAAGKLAVELVSNKTWDAAIPVSGTGAFEKLGVATTLTLGSEVPFAGHTGDVLVTGGTLSLDTALGVNAAVQSALAANAVRVGNLGILNVANAARPTTGAVVVRELSTQTAADTAASVLLGSAALRVTGGGEFAGVITGADNASLNVAATGGETLVLTGSSIAFTGTANVTAGTLELRDAGGLGASLGVKTLAVTGEGSVALTGANAGFSALKLATSQPVELNTTGAISVADGAVFEAFALTATAGELANNGGTIAVNNLVKTVLADGVLAITGGLVEVTDSAQFQRGLTEVLDGGVLKVNGAGAATIGYLGATSALSDGVAVLRVTGTGSEAAFASGLRIQPKVANPTAADYSDAGGLEWADGGTVTVGTAGSNRNLTLAAGSYLRGSATAAGLTVYGNVVKDTSTAAERIAFLGGSVTATGTTGFDFSAGGVVVFAGANRFKFTNGALTLAAGATLRFDLTGAVPVAEGAAIPAYPADDAARLTLDGQSFDGPGVSGLVFEVITPADFDTGSYPLIDARAVLSGISNAGLPADAALYYGGVRQTEELRIRSKTAGTPAFLGLVAGGAQGRVLSLAFVDADTNTTLTWRGGDAGEETVWRNDDGHAASASANNWDGKIAGLTIRNFLAGDSVIFPDSATYRDIIVSGEVSVGAGGITVNVSSGNYRFHGDETLANPSTANCISGDGGLTKTGSGELILEVRGSYSGATTVTAGTLTLRNLLATGGTRGGTVTIGTTGTAATLKLEYSEAGDGEFGKAITGTGAVIKDGDGTVWLPFPSDFAGKLTITDGALKLSGGVALWDAEAGAWSGADAVSNGSAGIEARPGATLEIAAGSRARTTGDAVFGNASTLSVPVATATGSTEANPLYIEALVAGGQLRFTGGAGDNRSIINIISYVEGVSVPVARAASISIPTYGLRAQVAYVDAAELVETPTPADVSLDTFMMTGIRKEAFAAGTVFGDGSTAAAAGEQLLIKNALVWNNTPVGTQHGTFLISNLHDAEGAVTNKVSFTIGSAPDSADALNGNYNYRATLADNPVARGGNGYNGWTGDTLTKTGDGTLILAGPNNYTGATTVSDGTLVLGDVRAAGAARDASDPTATAAVTLAPGTTLVFDIGAANLAAGTTAAAQNFYKEITGGGSVIKRGEGIVVLARDNTFSGPVTVEAGTLALLTAKAAGTNQTITLAAATATLELRVAGSRESITFDRRVTGAGRLLKTGAGEVVLEPTSLAGEYNTYAGDTVIAAGTLTIRNAAATGTGDIVSVADGAAFKVEIRAAADVWDYDKQLTGDGALIKAGPGTLVLSGVSVFNGAVRVEGGTLRQNGVAAGGVNDGSDGHVTELSNGAVLSVSTTKTLADFDGDTAAYEAEALLLRRVTGNGSLEKTGAGDLILARVDNLFTGGVTIRRGALVLRDNSAAGGNSGGAITFAPEKIAVLDPETGEPTDEEIDAATTLRFEVGSTTAGAADTTLWNFTQAITGPGDIVKAGAGTLQLSAANTFTGDTTVEAGTLEITGVLGAGGVYRGTVDLASALSRLSVAVTGTAPQTLAGAIVGSGSLEKTGGGTLTLSSNRNTYTGETFVRAGTLVVSGLLGADTAGATGNYNTRITIDTGATLELAQTLTQSLGASASVAGGGALIKSGTGTLRVTGSIANDGGFALRAGTLQVGATHGAAFITPQSLNLKNLIVEPVTGGAALAFDIYGDNLCDVLNVEAFTCDTAAGQLVFNLSRVVNGTYTLLIIGGDNAFPADFDPNTAITTLNNGRPLDPTSTLSVNYVLLPAEPLGGSGQPLQKLMLQVTGDDTGTASDLQNNAVTWGGGSLVTDAGSEYYGAYAGTWDVLNGGNLAWKRALPGYVASDARTEDVAFANGDAVLFGHVANVNATYSDPASLTNVIAVAATGGVRVSAMRVIGAATHVFTGNGIVGVPETRLDTGWVFDGVDAPADGSLVKSGLGALEFRGDGTASVIGSATDSSGATYATFTGAGGAFTAVAHTAGVLTVSNGALLAATRRVDADGGAFVIDASGRSNEAPNFTVSAGAELNLGSPAAAGSAATGAPNPATSGTITAGILVNSGLIAGNGIIRVADGGVFRNTASGIIRPGYSAGTIEIHGRFENAGTLELEVFSATEHDLIRYAGGDSGQANIEIGGTLLLTINRDTTLSFVNGSVTLPGLLQNITEDGSAKSAPELLDAEAQIEEQKGYARFSADLEIIFANLAYRGTMVDRNTGTILIRRDYNFLADPSVPESQRISLHSGLLAGTGGYLDALNDLAAAGSGGSLISGIDSLLDTDHAAAERALWQATPLAYGALTAMAVEGARAAGATLREHTASRRDSLVSRAGKVADGATSVWFSGIGAFGKNDSGNSAPVFDSDNYGSIVGVDGFVAPEVLLGAAFSGHLGRANVHDGGGRLTQDEFRVTAYGSVALANFLHLDGSVYGGVSRYETIRKVRLGDETLTNKASPDGYDFGGSLYLTGSAVLARGKGWSVSLTPFLGADYLRARVDTFSETTNLGEGGLHVEGFVQESLRARVGTGLNWFKSFGGKPETTLTAAAKSVPVPTTPSLRVSLNAAYGRELLDSDFRIGTNFINSASGAGTSASKRFTVRSYAVPEGVFEIGPSAELNFNSAISLGLSYSYETDFDFQTSHRLNATFRVRF